MIVRTGQTLIRVVVGFILPLAMFIMALLPLFLYHDRLPERLASHWGFNGPNGSMSFNTLVLVILVFVAVPAGGMLHSGIRWSTSGSRLKLIFPFWAFAGSLVAAMSWQIVRANLDVTDWHQAGQVALPVFGSCFSLAVLVGVFTYLMMRFVELPPEPEPPVPSAHLKPGERGVWVGSAKALWAEIMVPVIGVAGLVMIVRGMPMGFLLFLPLLLVVMFLRITVHVDNKGVRITLGPFGSTFRFIPLSDIKQARFIHVVVPLEHGGWGYRGSMKVFGRAALVLRRGEGIEIHLKDDKVLTVTVDDAEAGAGLINDLVNQAG